MHVDRTVSMTMEGESKLKKKAYLDCIANVGGELHAIADDERAEGSDRWRSAFQQWRKEKRRADSMDKDA